MIRHIVFFTAINNDNIESIRKGLQMLTGIPYAQHLEISLITVCDKMLCS